MDIHEIWRGHSANVTTFCFLSFHGQKIRQKLEKHKNIVMCNVLIQNINCVLNEIFASLCNLDLHILLAPSITLCSSRHYERVAGLEDDN